MDFVEELIGGEVAPPPPLAPPPLRADKVLGMLLGVALGDALGAPHERSGKRWAPQFTGRLEHPVTQFRRFQGRQFCGVVGQVTDDTEMTIALARSILAESGAELDAAPGAAPGAAPVAALVAKYSPERAAAHYMEWANSRCPFLGTNTRELFVGVKTQKGFRARLAGKRAAPRWEWSQSNGCLMRAAPLAVLQEGWARAVTADCSLSNFHPTCVDATVAYVGALRALLAGASPAEAAQAAAALAKEDDVAQVLEGARLGAARDVTEQKGWVLHALHCAFFALAMPPRVSFRERVEAVVRLGGDTDTNAAVAAGLVGASYGAAAMRADDVVDVNLDIVLDCDPDAGEFPRPAGYRAARIPGIARALSGLL